jgi:hypothetical protein
MIECFQKCLFDIIKPIIKILVKNNKNEFFFNELNKFVLLS